ncbi:hypothetical protein J7J47_04140 [Halomonas sp. ISL-60]|uniref:hypothetical protein n=1 Tax=Halomonas sp. ISL-56 TaxID=2819149 RepID=UPI001BE52200|nr:hypothetical protein [Halomonas sp. ISL-56]MBT2771422.1 hypothetical protein [Halomonas sp. ISL-60]MBT2801513.1 hypothetical protein [Halomonas sp. ISL-56]
MKSFQLNKTDITINETDTHFSIENAYVKPATREHINALGSGVIGEAWMISQPFQEGPSMIKFAPPQSSDVNTKTLALWAKCYRKIIIVSEREELTTLSIPLPGANSHVQGGEEAVREAVFALSDQLQHAKHLQHLHLYASDEESVWALFNSAS